MRATQDNTRWATALSGSLRTSSLAALMSLLIPLISLVCLANNAHADVVREPYLQNATPTSIILRWRTDTLSDSRVEYGVNIDALSSSAVDSEATTEHRVVVTGLTPDTQYFYAVGSTLGREAGNDTNHFFWTPPLAGSSTPTRIWALGDAGRAGPVQRDVRDAYLNLDNTHTNVVLLLGDNAYGSGTDAEYQTAIFDTYGDVLRHSPSWSTRGNHENDEAAYFDMFDHPTAGEAGGAASGSESYYSFDYGDIHFVCMDSFGSPRSPGSAQYLWLENDLASTSQRWIIGFWHHPPYSFGDHHSDFESGMARLRENAIPILEQYGVDMVLGGHNHFYTRSLLISGHHGQSSTFDPESHIVDDGSGTESGDGAYNKATSPEGGVYVVTGGASSDESTGAVHPTSYVEIRDSGSYVIDIDRDRLDARFVDQNGAVLDHVTIVKTPLENQPPVVDAGLGRTLELSGVVTLMGSVIDDGLPIPPNTLSLQWIQVDAPPMAQIVGATTLTPEITLTEIGTYAFRLSADDGEFTRTDDVVILVVPEAPPAAPTGMSAINGDERAFVNWSDNAEDDLTGYDVLRGDTTGGPYALIANVIPSNYSDTSVTNASTYFYIVRARDAGIEPSLDSAEVEATPQDDTTSPSQPTNLTAQAGNGSVILNWTDNPEFDFSTYTVKRSTQSGGPFQQIAFGSALSLYFDNFAQNGQTYYYTVSAFDLSGNQSVDAPEVMATPNVIVNQLPSVQIVDPTSGERFPVGFDVDFTATATDFDGEVVRVEFFADGELIGVEVLAPYNATFEFDTIGLVEIVAVATDDEDGQTTSAPIFIPEPRRTLLQATVLLVVAAMRSCGKRVTANR